MKGDKKIIDVLNDLLADELTAINQYMVHSEMCDSWGYEKLHKSTERRAIQEMKHAETLIGRILFLEGLPTVSKLNAIHVGADVAKQLANDQAAELEAIAAYNKAIALAGEVGDNGTSDMLTSTVKDEEAHLDWIEAQLDQIQQMGVQTYLSTQLKKDE